MGRIVALVNVSTRVALYYRASTATQATENQRNDLERVAADAGTGGSGVGRRVCNAGRVSLHFDGPDTCVLAHGLDESPAVVFGEGLRQIDNHDGGVVQILPLEGQPIAWMITDERVQQPRITRV